MAIDANHIPREAPSEVWKAREGKFAHNSCELYFSGSFQLLVVAVAVANP